MAQFRKRRGKTMEQRLLARRLPVRNAGSIASAVCRKERNEDIIGTTAVSAE